MKHKMKRTKKKTTTMSERTARTSKRIEPNKKEIEVWLWFIFILLTIRF